jgi:hypothetical protein
VALGWRERTWKRILVTLLAAALALTPWTLRNYLVFDRFIPVKSNLAYELFQSQCLQGDGVLDVATFKWHPNHPGSREQLDYQKLGELAYLDCKWRLFQQAVQEHPGDFLDRVAARFLAATVWYVPFNRAREARHPWLLWTRRLTHPLPFVALVLLIVAGMRKPLPCTHWSVIRIYLLYLLPYVAVSYYERYAVPMLTVKVMLVFWGADRALGYWRAPCQAAREVSMVVKRTSSVARSQTQLRSRRS